MPRFWKAIRLWFARTSGNAATPVVALIRGARDRDLLESIAARDGLEIHFADTCDEAWNAANRLKSPVVLCDREVPGIEWPDAVRMLAAAAPHPCVILASPVADDYLWKEIVVRGGYDVLATPLRDADAARAIKLAVSYWKNTSRGDARLPAFRK
jgi:DNA-binding NtrC family response regulator